MQRIRGSRATIFNALTLPYVRKKALNSWSAVQDTYFSTKDIFERHKVVFTISTSIASIGTAWVGYSIRYLHQAKVEQRLESIEQAMKSDRHIEHAELKKMVGIGSVSAAGCFATAGTALVIGYGLGWRGGRWYTNRKFRKEQLKMLGMKKTPRWQFQFLRRPYARSRVAENCSRDSEALADTATTISSKPTTNSELIKG
ncbi:hypothetical protein BVC80_8821g20 [Macleaya cordata]|uniref:Uncharacterized protein n=1 Tax=Macleaya cordata TaxID=56857 RepID=A0A200PSA1_MACCD|nr:hypothetical protein BVC80_8821g20 [Macleaya cordata]